MDYTVYCDESRHDGAHAHQYMAIGGLWIEAGEAEKLAGCFEQLRLRDPFTREVKWSRTKPMTLSLHTKVIDLFFDFQPASFRAIVVDQSRVDLARYHQGDNELGFYKFYYEMLEKWILPGNRYEILLDHKENRDPERYPTMRKILHNRAAKVGARIEGLDTVRSDEEPGVQICDLLTGAIAAACCEDLRPDSPKAQLAAHIARRAGFLSLKNSSLSPKFSKFNVFRIELR
jgi:hypothetical protein